MDMKPHHPHLLLPGLTALMLSGLPQLRAQSSLACYSSQPKKQNWAIGIRTGLAGEYDRSYTINNESRRLDWSQQVFLQNYIGRHFVLELSSIHQTSSKDNRSFMSYPGRHYSLAVRKSRRLNNSITLSYLFPTIEDRLQFSTGLGTGILASFDEVRETYITTTSAEPVESRSNTFHADGPAFIFTMTGNFKLNRSLFVSAQVHYSNNPNIELEHIAVNIGMGYLLY